MAQKRDKKFCIGCRDDFYNGNNQLGVQECWGFKTAKVMKRYRIGTWTQPTEPFAFTEVLTHDCHHRSGCSFYDKLPDFVDRKKVTRPSP